MFLLLAMELSLPSFLLSSSSPGEMAARTRMSQQKAEKVYHYMRYAFDAQMLPEKIT